MGAEDSVKSPPRLPPALEERIEPILKTIEEIKAEENYVKGKWIVVFKPAIAREKAEEIVRKIKPLSVKDVASFGRRGEGKIIRLLRFESKAVAERLRRSSRRIQMCCMSRGISRSRFRR